MQKAAIQFAGSFIFSGVSSVAFAHTGLDVAGLTAGLTHPLSGGDHLLAMLAVGLWAAQKGGSKRWLLPSAFVLSLAIGASVALTYPYLGLVEPGIVASVLVLGLVITLSLELPVLFSVTMTALFGFLHGYAHGLEMPDATAPAAYACGFLGATIALHLIGIGIGMIGRQRVMHLVRAMGAAITASGIWMALQL